MLDVLTALSDCRHETVYVKDHGTEDLGGFVYVLDKFPQRDLGLWVFMCPNNNSLFCLYFVSILCLSFRLLRRGLPRPILTTTGYHACVCIPAITPQYISIPRLSHLSYHAQPHTYIGLSHPPQLVVCSFPFTGYYATCSFHLHQHRGATRTNLLHMFHVSACGAIIAAATANSRRLSQQNPYKTCVSLLVELGRTSRDFIVHFEKIPTKKFPRYGRCAQTAVLVLFGPSCLFGALQAVAEAFGFGQMLGALQANEPERQNIPQLLIKTYLR